MEQEDQITSSQLIEPNPNPNPSRVRHRLEADWTFLMPLNDDQCYQFMKRSEYKMTTSHNNISRKCNVHQNPDGHKMLVAYRCASKNFLQTDSDTCQFRYCDKQCQNDKLHYVYQIKDSDHSKLISLLLVSRNESSKKTYQRKQRSSSYTTLR